MFGLGQCTFQNAMKNVLKDAFGEFVLVYSKNQEERHKHMQDSCRC